LTTFLSPVTATSINIPVHFSLSQIVMSGLLLRIIIIIGAQKDPMECPLVLLVNKDWKQGKHWAEHEVAGMQQRKEVAQWGWVTVGRAGIWAILTAPEGLPFGGNFKSVLFEIWMRSK
jgi:hypothetical protein